MMRISKLFAIAAFLIPVGLVGPITRAQTANPREVLWYRTPAPVWDKALPIVNGRLGAMVFGGANGGSLTGKDLDRANHVDRPPEVEVKEGSISEVAHHSVSTTDQHGRLSLSRRSELALATSIFEH